MLEDRRAPILFGLLAILILCSGMAASQPPPPSPSEAAQPEQGQTTSPQSGPGGYQQTATQPPVIVHVHPAEKTEAERADEARERKEKAELDRRLVELTAELANFTAGLFFATIALFIATAGLAYFGWHQSRDMKASIKAAQDAANAAKKSADAAVAAERAFLFVVISYDGVAMNAASPSEILVETLAEYAKRMSVTFSFTNFGKTPAILKEVSHQIIHAANEPAKEWTYALDLISKLPLVLGERDVSDTMTSWPESVISGADAKSALMGNTSIWFYGYAIYDDVFGREIEIRFRWRKSGNGSLRLDYQREFIRENDHRHDGGDPAS